MVYAKLPVIYMLYILLFSQFMNFSLITFCLLLMTASTTEYAFGDSEIKLPECGTTPNCVSSQASILNKRHYIEPFKIKLDFDVDVAWQTFRKALLNHDRIAISHESRDSLHAEATSLLFRFVDDIDAVLDRRAGLIHIRSASRIGHHDLGVNRKRIEKLRRKLHEAGVLI